MMIIKSKYNVMFLYLGPRFVLPRYTGFCSISMEDVMFLLVEDLGTTSLSMEVLSRIQ
jgi:hypothetical protein